MLRNAGLVALCALAAFGCSLGKPQEGAIRVVVTLSAQVRASCVVVEASSLSGEVLSDVRMAASPDKREYRVAVARGELPEEVGLRARALWGDGCADPLARISASQEFRSGFPLGEVRELTLAIAAPSAHDLDGDGFVTTAQGGLDCDDADARFHPAAIENCAEYQDLDCDGLAGCQDPSCAGKVCAEPGSALAFVTPALTIQAGACSGELRLEVRNMGGQPAPVATLTQVSLSAAPATSFGFYADPSCTQAVQSLELAPRQAQVGFYVRGEIAGEVAVTGRSGLLLPASQTQTLQPGPAARLGFVTPARTAPVGQCSAALTVESQDLLGNPSPVATVATLSLTAPASNFTLFRQADCTGPVAGLGIAAGQSRATFYFQSTSAGAVSLTAASAALLPATQVQTVSPGAPVGLAFATPARTVVAGDCSEVLTVQAQDSFGNASPLTAEASLALAGAPTNSFTLYAGPACAGAPVSAVLISAGQSGADFSFKAQVAGSGTLSASSGGLGTVSQQATITAAAATSLGFDTSPQGIAAGQCSGEVRIRSQDSFGNPSRVSVPTQVNLSSAPSSGFGVFSDSGCNNPISFVTLTPSAGTASFYFQGTAPVAHTLTAQATSLGSASQVQTIGVGLPAKLAITTAAQSRVAGTCSGLVTVQVQDVAGNPSNVGTSRTVVLAASPNPGGTDFLFFTDSSCNTPAVTSVTVTSGSASTSFYFRGTRAGAVDLTASSGSLTPVTQAQTITVASPSVLVFTSAAQSRLAGQCSQVATVEVRDGFGNPSPISAGAQLSLSASPATGFTFHASAGCATAAITTVQVAAGTSSASFYFKGTRVGTVMVEVDGAAALLAPVTQDEAISPALATALAFVTNAQTVNAGACSGIATVRAVDPFGNASPVTGAVTVALAGSPLSFFSNPGCTTSVTSTNIPGGSTSGSFYFSSTVAGSIEVTASNATLGQVAQTELISPLAPTVLAFTTDPQVLLAGACSGITSVQARDSYGNASPVTGGATVNLSALPGTGLTFHSSGGCSGPGVSSVAIGPGATNGNFYFKGTVANALTLTANAGSVGTATQAATINPGPPQQVVFVNPPIHQTVTLCSPALSLQLRDSFGNPSPVGSALTLSLTANPSAGFTFYSDATCATAITSLEVVSGASGAGFFFKGTSAGQVVVTATPSGTLSPVSQTQTVSGGPNELFFTTPPQTQRAGVCSQVLTVEARDGTGTATNVTASTQVTLSRAPSTGMLFYSDPTCQTAVTSVAIAAKASTASFYFKGVTGGAYSLTAAASFGSDTQGATVIPAVQSGSCLLADGQSTVNCPIPTPLSARSNSFVIFQATPADEVEPRRVFVRCSLDSVSSVSCFRVGNIGNVDIEWQTADLPGISVQHLPSVACTGATTNVSIPTAVTVATSFVLHSVSNEGGTMGPDDFRTVRLLDGSNVEVRVSDSGCPSSTTHSLQVVQFPGASVTRGLSGLMADGDSSRAVTGLSNVTRSRTALLYSWRTSSTSSDMCTKMLRGHLNADNQVTFSRSDGTGGSCNNDDIENIAFERIQFPTGTAVQQVVPTMGDGSGEANQAVASVDLTRTLVFTGGQITSGQAAGEGTHAGSLRLGTHLARLRLTSDTNLRLLRNSTSGDARWTAFVVQLVP